MNNSQYLKLLSGPLTFLLILLFVDLEPGNFHITQMAAITAWVAIWWLTEATHLSVTAFLPFLLIPMFGIADSKLVAAQYMDQTIFLFIGGFLLAFAIERWNLHKRIALGILSRLGNSPVSLLAGVMITAYLISMWISNTATTMMLISAVLAVIAEAEEQSLMPRHKDHFAKSVLIGLAYAASIGGMATLVGTPPNMVFYKTYLDTYPDAGNMSFFQWFLVGAPVSFFLLIAAFFILKWLFLRGTSDIRFDKSHFMKERNQLGKMSFEEKTVSIVFGITALLWFTRTDIDFGNFSMPGWDRLFGGHAKFITDSTVGIAMAFLLFLVPSKNEKGQTLLSWKEAAKLPFGIILLFGSGFALAKGFEESGLSNWLAGQLLFLEHANTIVVIAGICVIVCIISEFASNVASIQLVLPILISIQKATGISPLMLLVPATLAASLGFMLPVATAPNTIVFGSGRINSGAMRNAGSLLDLAGIIIITLFSALIGTLIWK
ncbi:MAG: SLC13/DASS family transporter [Chitinophagaceae bacterium]|nr:SLC13/DASS family transporter [Chitinophagaceae bacterium]